MFDNEANKVGLQKNKHTSSTTDCLSTKPFQLSRDGSMLTIDPFPQDPLSSHRNTSLLTLKPAIIFSSIVKMFECRVVFKLDMSSSANIVRANRGVENKTWLAST